MFQEPEIVEAAPRDIPLGSVHSNDKVVEEFEEQMEALHKLREKDMEKIASLSEKVEQVGQLGGYTGSKYNLSIQPLNTAFKYSL